MTGRPISTVALRTPSSSGRGICPSISSGIGPGSDGKRRSTSRRKVPPVRGFSTEADTRAGERPAVSAGRDPRGAAHAASATPWRRQSPAYGAHTFRVGRSHRSTKPITRIAETPTATPKRNDRVVGRRRMRLQVYTGRGPVATDSGDPSGGGGLDA